MAHNIRPETLAKVRAELKEADDPIMTGARVAAER